MKRKTFLTPEYIQTQVLNQRYGTYLKRFGGHIKVMPNEYYRIYDRNNRWIEMLSDNNLGTIVELMADKKWNCRQLNLAFKKMHKDDKLSIQEKE